MSSLNIQREPHWAAFPSEDTTIGQLMNAFRRFPDLQIQIGHEFEVSLVLDRLGSTPPKTDDLAAAIYGDEDPELIIAEDTGTFAAFDLEAQDRNAEPA